MKGNDDCEVCAPSFICLIYKKNALGQYEEKNSPEGGEKNNRSKDLEKTVKPALVLQVLSILDKEIASTLKDPKFILRLLKAKFRY